jgi:hypothetical protein
MILQRRLKNRKPKLIVSFFLFFFFLCVYHLISVLRFCFLIQDKIELQDFSLGSCPPTLGDQGMRWITSGDRVSHIYSELQVHLKVSLAHNLLKSDVQLLGSFFFSKNAGELRFIILRRKMG